MQKSVLWVMGGAVFGILIATVVALSIALWFRDGSDVAQGPAPQSPDVPTAGAGAAPSGTGAPDKDIQAANIEWIEPFKVPPNGKLGFPKVTPNYTKTTMIELKNDLYVQLWCRRESGSYFSAFKNFFISATANASQILKANGEVAEAAKNWTGEKGDAFCIAFKTWNLLPKRALQLTKGPDLPMTQKAYMASKPIDQKSEPCPGKVCLLGTRGAGADAITTCIELPSAHSPDKKPRSVVVGISNYQALIDKDYDPATKRWPVAAVGCDQRKF